MTTKLLMLCAAVLAIGVPAMAQDFQGSKDHPLVSRYPGSVIASYAARNYDEYIFPVGPVSPGGLPKSQKLEGKLTRISYTYPDERSALEVYRNFESALKGAGVQAIFTCANTACGTGRFHLTSDWYDTWYGAGDYHFSGKLTRPEGDAWISLHVGHGYAGLDIVETKPMETGLVTVNAAVIAGEIARTGHEPIYGIYFDTGKADIKPESAGTLQEIGKLLQQDPNLKLYVVGHTDNVGEFAMNMDLSRRRAESVVKALITSYSVAPARLQAHGNGPLAPVSSNKTEDGRAKNRRVELVER